MSVWLGPHPGRENLNDDFMLVYRDAPAAVHVGDTVRYVHYDWQDSRFYGKTGTVTWLRGSASLGIHFPHYARGTNLKTVAEHVRLVACVHDTPRTGDTNPCHSSAQAS